MRQSLRALVVLPFVVGATLVGAPTVGAQDAGGYKLVKKIPVGGEGGWDYAFVDAANRRLYVSHATKAIVIDLDKDAVVGEVTPANGIHGIAIAPELNRGFTSNGRDTSVTIFDLKTLATIGTVKTTGANPDAIWYDDASKRVFTFNGTGKNATAIDAATGTVAGTIPLPGKPEFAQTDGKGLLFVNIETDTGQIVVIDTKAMKEVKRYWLPGCEGPSGLSYDRKNDRLFSVCGNKQMAVSDPKAGKVVTLVPIGPGVDATNYDPELKLVFASNGGDGTMTVVKQEGADKYTVLGQATTQRGSRTMTLDPRTHKVYLAAVEYGPAPAPATPGGRAGRPPMVPGSFSVLVLDRK
jgi:DNA-binding beta-propeller fold protein YncE